MKKLMIAAAIVCAAAVSQAVTYNWAWNTSTSILKDGYTGKAPANQSPMASTTMYLFYADGVTIGSDTTFQTSVLAGLRGGTITDLTAVDGYVTQASTDANGQLLLANKKPFSMVREEGSELPAKSFFVEIVKTTYDGKDWYYFSAAAGGTTPTSTEMTGDITTTSGASTQLRDAAGTASYTSPGWYAVTVPEPTSGLLLLLGMAGLALRRRRA